MSRAICIPFHRYHPHYGDYYRVWMESLLTGLEIWGKEFDKLYLVDDYWDFNFEELDRLNKLGVKYEIIKRQKDGHHWVQFQTAFPHITEDFVLLLDNDVVIWKEGIVDNWFKHAESGEFVSAFDGSGGLIEPMRKAFPELPSNTHRMGTYYMILNKEQLETAKKTDLAPIHYKTGTFIPQLNYTTVDGDWQDSFGVLTYKIMEKHPKLFVIEDDRSSVYLQDKQINRDPETSKRLGYYHVRNGGHTTNLLSMKFSKDNDSYMHQLNITPERELYRIMAWHNIVGGYKHQDEIDSIFFDVWYKHHKEVPDKSIWQEYLELVKEYHNI